MKNNKKKFHINLTNEKLEISKYINSEFGTTDGSEVIFLGITRDNNFDRSVEKLFYESYKDMAVKEVEKIIYKIFENWEISYINIVHRLGVVLPSELSMILSVKSKHRKESFEASQFFVDELKKTVPIWKKEFFEDGTVWINDKIIE
jgi:molybdopterin synthase catalytic subunit